MPSYAEFFAGGGMVSAALFPDWDCVFANDNSEKKAQSYCENFEHRDVFCQEDISQLCGDQIPYADLFWASFPCQDLSVAGKGLGLAGERSGLVSEFWRLIHEMGDHKKPKIVCIENVVGLLRSNGGRDLIAVKEMFERHGYSVVVKTLDAVHFLPQSRQRLFLVGFSGTHSAKLAQECERVLAGFADIPTHDDAASFIEGDLVEMSWDSPEKTSALLKMMSSINKKKIETAKRSKIKQIGFCFKRTRTEGGVRLQRAEVRFDGVAGCLRTPGGGSSRQLIIEVVGNRVRSRLLAPREAARLMGLPETYKLPGSQNQALHLLGDGVAVPVVSWLRFNIFEPALLAPLQQVAAE